MDREAEITAKFWKALRSDMTVMLGTTEADQPLMRPMTAQFDGSDNRGPIWFFTVKENDIVEALGSKGGDGFISFADKGHDLFALVQGSLRVDRDRAVIDRLWNRFVAAWYEGGKDDPKLQLLRLDPEHAQVWLNENNLWAAVKLMLGRDPKQDYKDKVGDVQLGRH
jgi:general stress protein 26